MKSHINYKETHTWVNKEAAICFNFVFLGF